MKKVSINSNATFLADIQRAEYFLNIAYCLCLTKIYDLRKIAISSHFISFFAFHVSKLIFMSCNEENSNMTHDEPKN